jgi:DNA-binding response OmpR family regulator
MSETEQKKVLAVVYDPNIGRAINRILPKEEFSVEIAMSLEEARSKIKELLAIDVVITDWTQVNGAEVAKAAQEKGVEKIIIMDGGFPQKRELLEGLRESGINIIPKPFNKEELINAVRGEVAKTTEI